MFETSEFNVTYLLGAGASAEALPTVKNMSSKFEAVSEQLDSLTYDLGYKQYVSSLKDNLLWLAKKTKKYGTPDTFAKFLYLKNQAELPKLKNTLSAFFLIEQFVNNKLDERALIFLINIMQLTIFPGNVKILTWNYDFQLQKAAETFTAERLERRGIISKYTPPLIDYYPKLGNGNFNVIDISLVHLNGIAGSYYDNSQRLSKSFFERQEERTINHLFAILKDVNYYNGTSLSFAWEKGLFTEKIELSKTIARDTDILVVIGYSFPFFNRKIDKQIFDAFKETGKLKVIYYQDPIKSGEFLRNQFQLSDEIKIRDVKEVDNYFVPMEL